MPTANRTDLRQPDPGPRWLWVAVAVGLAAGVCSVALGWLLAMAGNELNACRGELGCFAAFAIGLFGAPFCAVSGALGGGLAARRASRDGDRTAAAIWRRSFGWGALASLLGAIIGLIALGMLDR